MTNPQTFCEKLTNYPLEMIADYGCCAFVALWLCGKKVTDLQAIEILSEAMNKQAIDLDCTVKWYDFCEYIGRPIKAVEFKDVTDIKKIKEKCAVRFDFNGRSHWVGVQNGKIRFNPLKSSVCVKYGKPTTARILTFEK